MTVAPTLHGTWLGTISNTLLRIPLASHPAGSVAAVAAIIDGNVTPTVAPPVGWVQHVSAHDVTAGVTVVVWTNTALPDSETDVDVSWTGAAKAAACAVVSADSGGVTAVGALTTVYAVATGEAGEALAVDGDIPVVFGGTVGGNPKRGPALDVTFTESVSNHEQQTGVDGWMLWGATQLVAGLTGAYTYAVDGTGSGAGGESYQSSVLILFAAAPNPGPNVTINEPSGVGCVTDPVTIAGHATATATVATVDVEIIRGADGLYWNGAAFVAGPVSVAAVLGTPAATSTTWSYTATGAFVDAGSYQVRVTATDGDPAPVASTTTRSTCVAGPSAAQTSRQPRLGHGDRIVVEVVGRPGGVSPGTVIHRLPIAATDGFFERRLDSTSEAEVVARYSPLDLRRCCDEIASIETFAHELRFWWDGKIAWVGPITWIEHQADALVLKAADRTVHWETRVIGAHTHTDAPLADVFRDYHADAYAQDPWDMTVLVQSVGVTGSRLVLASDGMVAERALSELARTAIDWTCVGDQLLIGGQEVPARAIATLDDSHFTNPLRVIEDGTLRATDFVMTGGADVNGTSNQPVSGRATLPETDPRRRRYGLITGRSQDAKIIDQVSVNQAARTRLDFGQDPIYIDCGEGLLRPGAPVDMVDLIPGARVDIVASATCRKVAAKFRVWRVKVTMAGDVAVQFQPLGTVTPGSL